MANGILGLLGNVGDRVQGLLSNPTVQGLGMAAATGFNPLLGLLAAPGIQSDRERKSMQNELLRQEISARNRQTEAQAQLPGLLSDTTPMVGPDRMIEGFNENIRIPGRMHQVPTISTPEGQRDAMGLLAQAYPQQFGEIVTSGLLGQVNPAAPQSFVTDTGKLFADLELAEQRGNDEAANALRSAIQSKVGTSVNFDDLRGTRNDVIRNSQDFLAAQAGYDRVKIGAASGSAAGDLATVFGIMKIFDPGSVVREGEFATAESAAGVPERIRGLYNRILHGERLTPQQRADFLSQARSQFEPMIEQQQRLIDDARGFSRRNNLPADDVVPEFLIPRALGAVEIQPPPEDPLRGPAETAGGVIRGVAESAGNLLERGVIDRAEELAQQGRDAVGEGANRIAVRVSDIRRMTRNQIQQINIEDVRDWTAEQRQALERRLDELGL